MKQLNLLSRAEMKKVMEGVVFPEEEWSVTCKFKYKTGGSNTWTNWSAPTEYFMGDCNSWCVTFIQQNSVDSCAYETVATTIE